MEFGSVVREVARQLKTASLTTDRWAEMILTMVYENFSGVARQGVWVNQSVDPSTVVNLCLNSELYVNESRDNRSSVVPSTIHRIKAGVYRR